MKIRKKYTDNVDKKFNTDGSMRSFKGNTVICMLDKNNPAFKHVLHVKNIFKKLKTADEIYSFLPISSYHMTMIDGVWDQFRTPSIWPNKLPLDIELEKVNEFFKEQTKYLPETQDFSMIFSGIRHKDDLQIGLKPADEKSAIFLKDYRNSFSEVTGLRFKNHETYEFHISLAYKIIEFDSEKNRDFLLLVNETNDYLNKNLGTINGLKPRLSYYDDMSAFPAL